MENNIGKDDINKLCDFLQGTDRFTQGPQVQAFEAAWSKWLGHRHSVFVNSGSSANLVTLLALSEKMNLPRQGEVITSPLNWSSDIASIFLAGFKPRFIDIDFKTLAMSPSLLETAKTPNTLAVLLTHILGFSGMTETMEVLLQTLELPLIEDVCESHGATYKNQKLGTLGLASNFSFYYAHHMTTIEGGMISTSDDDFYDLCRRIRSHGLLREAATTSAQEAFKSERPDLNQDFIFTHLGLNVRSTELNAVLGLNQLTSLDERIDRRNKNATQLYSQLNSDTFYTDFRFEGMSNYAFVIMLNPNQSQKWKDQAMTRLKAFLHSENIEFRQGTSGGGNMLRQPFIQKRLGPIDLADFPNVEHVHNYAVYVGNYPSLCEDKIQGFIEGLNVILS